VTTYLNVPFRDKAEAKAKGARWDSEARKWFVPLGRDLQPFTNWLPVDPSTLGSQDLAESSKGVLRSKRPSAFSCSRIWRLRASRSPRV
jgi:exodeoxyribonuclease VII large subunit